MTNIKLIALIAGAAVLAGAPALICQDSPRTETSADRGEFNTKKRQKSQTAKLYDAFRRPPPYRHDQKHQF